MSQMWTYSKSALHQAAIDKVKIETDRNVARAITEDFKLKRERDAAKAMKEYQEERIATLAKTARLRAERLVRIADAGPTPKLKRRPS